MRCIPYIVLYVVLLVLHSCQSEPSLQRYFVDKSESKDFIALDLSPSILNIDKSKLTTTQKEALGSFDKMNILAFKLNDKNKAQFELERAKVDMILKDEKYQQLMKFGSGQEGASVSFVGDDEHIDEFVFFANKKENGFAVVRVLGKDMNPTMVFNMISVLKEVDVNLDQLKPLQDLMIK
jgi:Domain of unknown function (DUF4252)